MKEKYIILIITLCLEMFDLEMEVKFLTFENFARVFIY